MLSDVDMELLELLLDGELSPDQARALRARIADEPDLARALAAIESQRQARDEYYTSLEADAAAAARVCAAVRRGVRRHHAALYLRRALAACSAAAACLAAGLLIVHVLGPAGSPADRSALARPIYHSVAITDENGTLLGVQKFDSLEKAREFSEDLARWQEMQRRMRDGLVTVRATSF